LLTLTGDWGAAADRDHGRPPQNLRIPFVENGGQIRDPAVRYHAAIFGGSVQVCDSGEILYAVQSEGTGGHCFVERPSGVTAPPLTGEERAATQVSFIKGRDPAEWQTGLPSWHQVSYGEIYSGIRLVLQAHARNVEKLFYVAPGADPAAIRMQVDGVEGLAVTDNGELALSTPRGTVCFSEPLAFQTAEDGRREAVPAEYAVLDTMTYGFRVGEYDHGRELVIDPLLASTFMSSGSWAGDERVMGMAIGASNEVYVVGYTEESTFPYTSGAYQTGYGGGTYDAFVSKLDGGLSNLLASTFLGGNNSDRGRGVALDSEGNVYVTGRSSSTNFPATAGAFSNALNGTSSDAFICKFDPDLTNLLAGTLFGGSHGDGGYAITVEPSGVYVAGDTLSMNDFPTTPGAYQSTNQGDSDAFVCRFDPGLSNLLAGTMIGGHYDEECRAVAVDTNGNMYIAGQTESAPGLLPPPFPVTSSAYCTNWGNGGGLLWDGFICRFSPSAGLLASTYLGGTSEEEINGLALDSSNNVYVAGFTGSANFPTTPEAYATNNASAKEAIVSKLDSSLSYLLASTYLGGGNDDKAYAVTVHPMGIFVTGYTYADDFPTTPGAYQRERDYNTEVFVTRLDPDLTNIWASTYLGEHEPETGYARERRRRRGLHFEVRPPAVRHTNE